MFGLKSSTKTKRKLIKTPTIQMNSINDNKILHNIPSVSKIAPLPENKSHGILPVLSLDGRDSSSLNQSDEDLSTNIEKTNNLQPVGKQKEKKTQTMTFEFLVHFRFFPCQSTN